MLLRYMVMMHFIEWMKRIAAARVHIAHRQAFMAGKIYHLNILLLSIVRLAKKVGCDLITILQFKEIK